MPDKRIDLIDLIRRLQDADSLLAGEGLRAQVFANEHGISHRAVVRLLATLRELGRETEVRHDADADRNTHHYSRGVARLFVAPSADVAHFGRRRVLDRGEMQRLKDQGMTAVGIAAAMGCSEITVRTTVGPFGRRRSGRDYDHEAMRDMARSGATHQEIIAKFGASMTTVRHICGDIFDGRSRKRTLRRMRPLKNKIDRAARYVRLKSKGYSYAEIARAEGKTRQQISAEVAWLVANG